MNVNPANSKNGATHDQMEATASVLRSKLASTVKELDERWGSLFDVGQRVRNHPTAFILAGSGILLAVTGGIAAGILENRRKKTFSYQLKKGLCQLQKFVKDIY